MILSQYKRSTFGRHETLDPGQLSLFITAHPAGADPRSAGGASEHAALVQPQPQPLTLARSSPALYSAGVPFSSDRNGPVISIVMAGLV